MGNQINVDIETLTRKQQMWTGDFHMGVYQPYQKKINGKSAQHIMSH